MHLLEVAVLFLYTVLIQGDIAYESGQGYYDDPEFGDFKDHPGKELEEQLRAVSSVDELMTLLYPESWKMFKCQLRQGGQPSSDNRRDGSLKFAAAHSNYNAEIWKSIEIEWRKTQCIPREVCVDVGKEFGASTNTFFKPPCVSLYRCGGCCNSEGLQCMNTSSTYVSKTDHPGKELEEQLRAVSSVDELMTLLYPESWKMFKCQLRQGGQPSSDNRRDGSLKFAAAHSNYNAEIWKSIEIEWRKTQCIPREVCVDVGKEFGASTNTFFKPPCVSLYRCGGCCNSEGLQCMNTSSTYVSKTLFEITVPLSQGPIKPVTISFANHTSCRCMSKLDVYRQVHSIIRRSLPATQVHCQVANKTCPRNHIWNNHLCRCIQHHDFSSHPEESDSSESFHDICGPNKELDEETCQCVCKGGLLPSSCGPHKELDRTSCQCVCKNKLLSTSCGTNKEYDEDKCQCVCKKTCPKHQPLNPMKCACECVETPNKCFLRGKKFHPQTCSCHRPPCTTRPRRCDPGFSYSEEVCRCVPTYWKRPHMN